jgi:type II secretory pathway component PulF
MTEAALKALSYEPHTANVLLSAIADCHQDRARGGLSATQWLIGPVAIGLVGVFVGFVVIALFMPLISLVNALS